MKIAFLLLSFLLAVDAYAPNSPSPLKKAGTVTKSTSNDWSKAAAGAFAALTIASTVAFSPPPAEAVSPMFSSSQTVAAKVIREGVYGEYEVDLPEQVYDDARSTFKAAKETKSKKGKYTAILAILIVGSFVVPMAQYFWYVRDDDTTDKFFSTQKQPEPEPPKKKKGWF